MVVVGFNATSSGDLLLAPMDAECLALFWNALGWVLLGPPEVIILVGVDFGVGFLFRFFGGGLLDCWTGGLLDWGIGECGVWSGAG